MLAESFGQFRLQSVCRISSRVCWPICGIATPFYSFFCTAFSKKSRIFSKKKSRIFFFNQKILETQQKNFTKPFENHSRPYLEHSGAIFSHISIFVCLVLTENLKNQKSLIWPKIETRKKFQTLKAKFGHRRCALKFA